MFRSTDSAGTAGDPFDDSVPSPSAPRRSGGRVRGADFGLPERAGLVDLARTYLETQARLWPDLAGTVLLPAADAATVEAMADDFTRRFRGDRAEVFAAGRSPRPWTALGVAYLRFSDENSNPRSLDQQLLNVLTRARRDDVFIPWRYVLADAAVSGTLAFRRGYSLAKQLVEQRDASGVSWFFIDDLSRMSRNTIESLRLGELAAETGVRVVGASDGFDSSNPQSSLLLPVLGSMNEAFITQLRSKVKRGMDDAFRRGDNIQPPGAGYRLVEVRSPDGSLVLTHKGTIEKAVEIDPEAADWIRRGATMIAHEGKSALDVARLFNAESVAGLRTWTDGRVRDLYRRERLVGEDVFRKTRHVVNRQTGRRKVERLPASEWLRRDVPHLRIVPDDLARAVKEKLRRGSEAFGPLAKSRQAKAGRAVIYPKPLLRPICGGCGKPMILGRSRGRYQSFVCGNAMNGAKGCTNRGYKSAKILDEAVLGTVMATLFTDSFIDRLTEEVNGQLSRAARQPVASTKDLEKEIASRERQVSRLAAKLERLDDDGSIDAIFDRVRTMERDLAAKREELATIRQRNQGPRVGRVKRQEVVAALGNLRELLQGDVAVAAEVLAALVGDVVIESQRVEGAAKPRMVARFTINAIPALAELRRRPQSGSGTDDPTDSVWEFLNGDRWIMPDEAARSRFPVEIPLEKPPKHVVLLPQIAAMADAGSGVDLISRALGTSAEVVRDALHLHRTGVHPPKRIDPRRRRQRQPSGTWAPTYRRISAEVDRRRKAGESFDRLAREMNVSRGTIVRAYDFANRAEALAAAQSGRKPTRPAWRSGP